MTSYWGKIILLLAVSLLNAQAVTPVTVVLQNSTKSVATAPSTGAVNPHLPYISRQTLTSAESTAPMVFEVALKMRNFAELQSRVSRGEHILPAEMAEKYEPSPANYLAMADWLTGEGFTIVRQDPHHVAIFVRGKVSQIAQALKVNFARVTSEGTEYTSAVTAPSVPANLSPLLTGINGLQPHIRAHKHLIKQQAHPNALTGSASYSPSQIAQAYDATGLYNSNISGAGQTIAIVIDTFPSTADLLLFWKNCNINQSISNIQFVQAVAGTLPSPSGEETLDVEWSSAIAPGAHIRVYAATDLASADLDQAYQQVYNDVTNHPGLGIHQMSMSYGGGEVDSTKAQVDTDDQYFSELAAAGVTLFAASGDEGPTPDLDEGGSERYSIQVESPASDPNVTGVGGTTLILGSNNSVSSEVAWNNSSGASGGGTSVYFSRPSWQTGTGVPAGTMREVPDVAGPADPNYGAITYLAGAESVVGGTSWASPTWAGLCALVNQARANAGLTPLGSLGSYLYPILGSANYSTNIRDITSGNNDTQGNNGFSAGVGYDMVTGIGTPLAQSLAQTLVGSPTLVGVKMPPAMQSVTPGQDATFTVAVDGSSATYQWQRMPVGGTTWSNLGDNGTYSGSTTASLTVSDTTPAISGDQFQCLITLSGNVVTTTTSSALIVDTPLVISTLAGTAGTSGLQNGTGTAANFNFPSGIAIDTSGNLYIADYSNNEIREVTSTGVVTTPYGSLTGASGRTNASGNSALFKTPNGIVADSSNNLYVADTGNNLIRKIASGAVSTLAGTGGQFNTPEGVAIDSSGNVYVADTGNDTIEKITSSGSVSIIAGQKGTAGYADGAATTQALFNGPSSVAVDSSGNVYVADFGNCVIREISSAGTVSTIAGQANVSGYLDGPGGTALFNAPTGLTLDSSNNLYVTDALVPPQSSNAAGNDLVRKVTPTGVVSTIAGQAGNEGTSNGTGTAAQFYSVQAIALYNSTGTVYLADTYNQTIRMGIPVGFPPTITSSDSATFAVGLAGSFTVTATGYPAPAFSATGLPAWASLNSQTGVISGTPTSTGTSTISVTATNSAGTATATVTIHAETPVTFSQWETANNINSAPTATPENDGVPNLLKYLYDINPTVPMSATDYAALPAMGMTTSGESQYLTLTYREYALETGITVNVQTSTDLQAWTTVNPPDLFQQTGTDSNTGDPIIEVGVIMPSNAAKQFLRLNVTQP